MGSNGGVGFCVFVPEAGGGCGGGVQGGFLEKNVKSGGTSIGQCLSPPPFPVAPSVFLSSDFQWWCTLYTVRQLLLLLLLLCRESPNCR